MKSKKLTNKEVEILQILWAAKTELTAKQMIELEPTLIMSTVQTTLRSLLKKNLIEIAEIKYDDKVMSRSFLPLISREEFIMDQYEDINLNKFVTAFLGESSPSNEEIKQIESILDKYKSDNF